MIRRLEQTDAQTVHDFLVKLYAEDPDTGGLAPMPVHRIENHADKGDDFYVAIEDGKLVGLLAGHGRGHRQSAAAISAEAETFTLFDLLAIDHELYKGSRKEALRIAGELTLFAADDLRDSDKMTDYIYVRGPTVSRGASWCRLLKMEETQRDDTSEFWLPFKDIWDRVKGI